MTEENDDTNDVMDLGNLLTAERNVLRARESFKDAEAELIQSHVDDGHYAPDMERAADVINGTLGTIKEQIMGMGTVAHDEDTGVEAVAIRTDHPGLLVYVRYGPRNRRYTYSVETAEEGTVTRATVTGGVDLQSGSEVDPTDFRSFSNVAWEDAAELLATKTDVISQPPDKEWVEVLKAGE